MLKCACAITRHSSPSLQHGKIKINCLEECKKLGKYQTIYLVKTFIFIISTWWVYSGCTLSLIAWKVFRSQMDTSYGWMRLMGPSDPNEVFRHQVTMSRHFFRFHDFIGFISWFLKKWHPVCENWSQGSELMAGYVFWAQVAQIKFVGPRSQGQDIFSDFIILFDSSHDFWKNDSLLVKIRARVMNLWLDTSSEHKWPKCSF